MNLALRKEAMANAKSKNNARQLSNEIRNTHPTYSNCVDAAIGADNIVSLFTKKYNALYNSVCYEHNEMSNLCTDITYVIDKSCIQHEDDKILAYKYNSIIYV